MQFDGNISKFSLKVFQRLHTIFLLVNSLANFRQPKISKYFCPGTFKGNNFFSVRCVYTQCPERWDFITFANYL